MNIISNNCLAGYLYQQLKISYSNPFIWTSIYGDSLETLVFNFDKIDFSNYEIHKDTKWNFWFIIDNKIRVDFTHHKFDANANVPYKKDSNLFYNKIWEYIVNKYDNRLCKMNEEPVFVLDFWKTQYKQKKHLCSLKTLNEESYFEMWLNKDYPHKTIIIQPFIKENKKIKNNLYIIYDKHLDDIQNDGDPGGIAKRHYKEIKKIIKTGEI